MAGTKNLPADIKTEELLLNMGPQHPSTHGVFKVIIRTDGEMVLSSESHCGFLHRCAEKIAENVTYIQYVPYTDRMDYLAAMCNNLGYCLAVEELAGVREAVPERGQYLRIIAAELSRIASHLMSVGTYGLDVGAITPFLHCFREREMILRLLEDMCGQRLNYHYISIGGVKRDFPPFLIPKILNFLDWFEKKVPEYNELLTGNGVFLERTCGVGVIPPEMAIAWGLTGPVLRGSGIDRDLRRDSPYSIYDRFSFNVIVAKGGEGVIGDCWNRYYVRVWEMLESVKIIRQAIKDLPGGADNPDNLPVNDAKIAKQQLGFKAPAGEVYLAVENPRGELGFHIISDGKGPRPVRCKVRSPAYCNISILDHMSKGALVADLVAIIGSIDIVMGEVDR
ncbi:MAG: NADH-quinone oxidoreductase subunit D [Planctomycetes bacterium]|nr:NADH-quinone oxidoreductase subunit D [Planctomycetota bacterium]